MHVAAILYVLHALPQLVRDVAVPLVLVSGVLYDGGRDGRRRHYAQDVARVDQLEQALQELGTDLHVLRLEGEVVRWRAGRLKKTRRRTLATKNVFI